MSRVVIKPGNERITSRGTSALDLRDISTKADALIASARQEAERILSEARSHAAVVRDAAHREGYDAGTAEGMTRGDAEGRETALAEARARLKADQASLVKALTEAMQAFSHQREQFLSAARRDAVALAVAIAQRVARKLSKIDEAAMEMAAEACAEALQSIAESSEVTVRVHPADAGAVSELTAELADLVKSARGVRLSADESVGRGGVIVSTSDCVVDATVSGRIDRIADELLAGWRKRIEGWSGGS